MRGTLFISPSFSSPILCLPLCLFEIICCLTPLISNFPFLLNAHHCLTVLQLQPISLLAGSSVVEFSLSTPNTHTHTTHTFLHDGGSYSPSFNYYTNLSASAGCACCYYWQGCPASKQVHRPPSLSLFLPLYHPVSLSHSLSLHLCESFPINYYPILPLSISYVMLLRHPGLCMCSSSLNLLPTTSLPNPLLSTTCPSFFPPPWSPSLPQVLLSLSALQAFSQVSTLGETPLK